MNLHRRHRLSAVSLTQKESIELTAALHDLILQPDQQFHSMTMPMRTRSLQPSPAPATTFSNNPTDSTSSPTYPPVPTPIPHNPSIANTLPAPSGAKELVVAEKVTEDGVRLREYPDGRVVALSLPQKLQIPSGSETIFAGLYRGLPNQPTEVGTIPPSPIQILQAWVASDPVTWPADDPYFTRTSTLEGVAWHVNSRMLELVAASVEILHESLNEVYDLLVNVVTILTRTTK